MSLISVITPCYNEEENIEEAYKQVKSVFESLKKYSYEHIFIDNASKDKTVEILKNIARRDKNVKIIVNNRNFGRIRSPYYGLLQARGEAGIIIAADLQEPPALIADFLKKWEEGYKTVIGAKRRKEEKFFMSILRKRFYGFMERLSEIDFIKGFTGFGLYDRRVIDILHQVDDPYPYLRGLISDIGLERFEITYEQSRRKGRARGKSFYALYDTLMLGITNYSKVPLRLATMVGFILALLCLLVALGYLIYKLIFWDSFSVGIAPVVIGFFFFSAVQLLFIGIIGEYVGSIHTQVLKRPLVIEKERINFD